PGCEKHRPNNVAVSDWYACESFGTTSPGKVQKHRFDAIIKVMRCCDGAVSVFFNQVFEPLIAKIPGSHLDGYPLLIRILLRIEASRVIRVIQFIRSGFQKRFILIRGSSPELKIAMRNGNIEACFRKQMPYTHRIDASAAREKY